MRIVLGRCCVVFAIAAACLGERNAEAGPRNRITPEIKLEERLGQSLRARGRRTVQGVAIVESRMTELTIRVAFPEGQDAFADPSTLIGLRVGGTTVETTLGSDPRWRPGRTSAHVVLPAAGPGSADGRLSLTWRRGKLHARGRLPGRSPYADLRAASASGPTEGAFDAALRIGGASLRFAGLLTGAVDGRDVPVLGTPVHVANVRLEGTGRSVPVSEDGAPPQVTIGAPAEGRLVPTGSVSVQGSLRDDRTIVRVTVAIDDGAEIETPFTRDTATGYLDDLVATFAAPVAVAEGTHAVTVRAYDAGGNVGASAVGFFAGQAPTDAFDAGDAQGSSVPSYAAIDGSGQVRRSISPASPVEGLQGSIAVATSPTALFALRADGTVVAFGSNTLGTLGNGTTDPSAVPVTVTGLTGITALSAGGAFGVALRADGTVWTWGDGRSGALGDGTLTSVPRTIAARVEGLPVIRSIGSWSHGAIAVDTDGEVWIWGSSTFAGTLTTPTKVTGPTGVAAASAGFNGAHFLAVTTTGEVWAWGSNAYGQLGRPAVEGAVPAKVPGVTGATAVACGRDHSLVLLGDGTLLGLGRDLYGTLGDGAQNSTGRYAPPFVVPLIDQVVDIDAGYDTSLALRADGTVWAWGSANNRNVPTQVAGF